MWPLYSLNAPTREETAHSNRGAGRERQPDGRHARERDDGDADGER
jgi:hypothetical protein